MFKNEYLLDVDLKFKSSFVPPRFRRNDTAILKFRIHDNGVAFNITDVDEVEISIEMPSKKTLKDYGTIEYVDGIGIIKFQFASIHMIEIGDYTIYLTLIQDGKRVSPTPIKVRFYDHLNQSDLSFIDVIDGMKQEIETLKTQLSLGINTSEIGQPNGVAPLNSSGILVDSEIPIYMDTHIGAIMRSDEGAHNFSISETGVPLYKNNNGEWKEVVFAEFPIGGGATLHTPPTIKVENGVVAITFPDGDVPSLQKWDAGERDATWFQSNGYAFTGSGFQVIVSGAYTYYYKLSDGREFIIVFAVTESQLSQSNQPKVPIKNIPNNTLVEISGITWQILDASKGMLWQSKVSNYGQIVGYDENETKASRTRNYDSSKATHVAKYLNTNLYNTFSAEFKNAIKLASWKNTDEIGGSSFNTSAYIGFLTLDEWLKYKNVLKYTDEIYQPWSYTITKSSTNSEQIFAYPLNNNVSNTYSVYDVFQYSASAGVNNAMCPRMVVYIDPNFEVEYDSGSNTGEMLEPIESFNEGDFVKFGGYNWILIDKANRKLVARNPVALRPFGDTIEDYIFNPTNPNNIAHWLNNDFLSSIHNQVRDKVMLKTWDISASGQQGTFNNLVNCQVGLLTENDVINRKSQLSHFAQSANAWLMTLMNAYSSATMIPTENTLDIISNNQSSLWFNVHPVIYLESGTEVSSVKFSNVAVNTLEVGNYVNLGGYEWVNMGDGIFAMSKIWQKGTFSEAFESNKFNVTTGIGRRLEIAKNNLFARDISKLTMLNTSVGAPDSGETVYVNLSLIGYNDWINKYRTIAKQYFRDDENYWLANNTAWSPDTVYSYRRKSSEDLTGTKTTSTSGIRPIVKLSLSAMVEIENNIDKMGYAYIPDVELRKILNSILGKGQDNPAKITVSEMYSITDFDVVTLGNVADLTGMELLVNVEKIRATFATFTGSPTNKVGFTDISPLAQLGKGKNLLGFELYGINNVTENVILHQLKGKFPNIEYGNIRGDAGNNIWIDTWELKGVTDKPIFNRMRTGYANYTANGSTEYSVVSFVTDYSAPITKWKPFNSSVYVPYFKQISPTDSMDSIPQNTESTISESIFKYDETTPDGKYTIGFENANGKKSELHYIVQDHLVYLAFDEEPTISLITMMSDVKINSLDTWTVPSVIDGRNVTEIGNCNNIQFDKDYNIGCSEVIVPSSVNKIYSFIGSQTTPLSIKVLNQDVEFVRPEYTFISHKDSKPILILQGKRGSTLEAMAQKRAHLGTYVFREI